MPKPFISIGIIFKNEIRCLERCLNSLTTLREAIPCELVMADTGSDDGSREIAEKYADIVFDFPWVNDFSAARNAVMDRCTGRWYFSLDADEWLDGDIKELLKFARDGRNNTAYVTVRNYLVEALDGNYQDSILPRLLRLSTKIRFTGTIHEHWEYPKGTQADMLSQTILHHDGYVGLNDDRGKGKRARNMDLLKMELEKDPHNLRTLLECMESSRPEPDQIDYIRQGLQGVEEHWHDWEYFGAPILRYAVFEADAKNMPELDEWVAKAEELFPESFFTRLDVEGIIANRCWRENDYAGCIRRSERFLAAFKEYHAGAGDRRDLRFSTVVLSMQNWEKQIRELLAKSYLKERKPDRALELLKKLDRETVLEVVKTLRKLHTNTEEDTAPAVLQLFERIEQDETKSGELLLVFKQAASAMFSDKQRKKDRESCAVRPAYTLYLPLAGKCEAGTAAAILEAQSVQEMDELLGKVQKWGDFPITVLAEALKRDVHFPLPDLSLDAMDDLAKRLANVDGAVLAELSTQNMDDNFRQLLWGRSMTLAAVQSADWKDVAAGHALAKAFVKMENAYLPRCYMPEILCEENIQLLPPMHRFGWYCSRAFGALEAGDTAGYVRLLRAGLEVCPGMKAMVEFLTEHTPQLKPPVPGELLALAEQVRTLLAQYAPDDPAVVMLKQSSAYQKVAQLIEGPEPGAFGGLKQ